MKLTAFALLLAFAAPACLAQGAGPDDAPKQDPAGEDEEPGEDEDPGGDEQPNDPEEKKLSKEERRKLKQAQRDGRELAPETPEAMALAKLLKREANYASDGTVKLVYEFTDRTQSGDWDQRGFDVAEETVRAKGKRRKRARDAGKRTKFLNLNVGSQSKGLLLHVLEMKGEFEVTFEGRIDRMSTRSDLVFAVGKGGLRFGSQFVKGSRGSYKPAVKSAVDRSAFEGRQGFTVRLVCGSGKISAFVNGQQVGETTKLKGKLDGRIGIYATDMSFYLSKVEIQGEINKRKL